MNSLMRKVKILVLKPKSTISNSYAIDSLFVSNVDYQKDKIYKLTLSAL